MLYKAKLPGPAGKENKSRPQQHGSLRKKPMVKNGVEWTECSLRKSVILLSKTATFILVENIVHKNAIWFLSHQHNSLS